MREDEGERGELGCRVNFCKWRLEDVPESLTGGCANMLAMARPSFSLEGECT